MTTVFTLLVVSTGTAAMLLCCVTIRRWIASAETDRHRYAIELVWAAVPLALLAAIVAMLAPPGHA